jgi:hypothetical protein
MSKLQKPSALKRGHPTLQNMNFDKFFLLLWVIFGLLDPDPDSGSGSTGPIEYGSNSDPKPCLEPEPHRDIKKAGKWIGSVGNVPTRTANPYLHFDQRPDPGFFVTKNG